GDTVDPNREGIPKGGASLNCWADEVGDNRAARLDHPIAHPSHAACMLDTVGVAETEIARDVRAHLVSVEHDRIEERCECGRERSLARAGQAHDQDLAHQYLRMREVNVAPTDDHHSTGAPSKIHSDDRPL